MIIPGCISFALSHHVMQNYLSNTLFPYDSENSMEMNDVALDEAWNEMNIILQLIEEYLVPLLNEDINREPTRYYGYIPWMQDRVYQQGMFGAI